MKYLKKFENNKENKELVHKFKDSMLILVTQFLKDNNYDAIVHCKDYVQNGNYYENFKYIMSFTSNEKKTDVFLEISIICNVDKFEVLFEPNYIGIDSYKITEKFKVFFAPIIQPLSFSYDDDIEFDLRKDKFIELISELSIEKYNLRKNISDFNV